MIPTAWFEYWGSAAWATTLKSPFLVLAACLAVWVLRHRAAAARHRVWMLVFAGLLLLGPGAVLLPAWNVAAPVRSPDPVAVARAIIPLPAPPGSEASGAGEGRSLDNRALAIAHVTLDNRDRLVQLLFLVWAAGAVFVLLRQLRAMLALSRLPRACAVPESVDMASVQLRAAAAELHLKQPVTLLYAHERASAVPMTWGWARPVILLPAAARAWPEERRWAVLLHECAHIKRGDWLIQVFSRIACALNWFNPLVWWAERRLRDSAEAACDDQVLTLGVKPSAYATHLLEVVNMLNRTRMSHFAAGVAESSNLGRRVKEILSDDRPRYERGHLGLAGAVAGAVLLLVPLAALKSEPAPAVAALPKTAYAARYLCFSARPRPGKAGGRLDLDFDGANEKAPLARDPRAFVAALAQQAPNWELRYGQARDGLFDNDGVCTVHATRVTEDPAGFTLDATLSLQEDKRAAAQRDRGALVLSHSGTAAWNPGPTGGAVGSNWGPNTEDVMPQRIHSVVSDQGPASFAGIVYTLTPAAVP